MGIMEKKMEAIIVYRGNIGVIWGLYRGYTGVMLFRLSGCFVVKHVAFSV